MSNDENNVPDGADGNTGADAPNSGNELTLEEYKLKLAESERKTAAAHREAQQQREAHKGTKTELETLRTGQLQENEQWKTLYDEERNKNAELSSKAGQVEIYSNALRESNERRIEKIPPEFKEEVEFLAETLTPDKLSKFLDTTNYARKPVPETHAGAGGASGVAPKGDGVVVTDVDKKQALETFNGPYRNNRTLEEIEQTIAAYRNQ